MVDHEVNRVGNGGLEVAGGEIGENGLFQHEFRNPGGATAEKSSGKRKRCIGECQGARGWGEGRSSQAIEGLVLGKVFGVGKRVAEDEGLHPAALVLGEQLGEEATEGSPKEVDLIRKGRRGVRKERGEGAKMGAKGEPCRG